MDAGQCKLTRRCGDKEGLLELQRSVFYHLLSIIPVLCTAMLLR